MKIAHTLRIAGYRDAQIGRAIAERHDARSPDKVTTVEIKGAKITWGFDHVFVRLPDNAPDTVKNALTERGFRLSDRGVWSYLRTGYAWYWARKICETL